VPAIGRRAIAEFIGTFWLVFGGTGSAVLAAIFLTPLHVPVGIGFAGVALAFGLTVLTMAYALGHICGAHFNPAVTIGLWAGKRFPAREILPYVVAQVVGAIVASGVLYAIVAGGSTGAAAFERTRRGVVNAELRPRAVARTARPRRPTPRCVSVAVAGACRAWPRQPGTVS